MENLTAEASFLNRLVISKPYARKKLIIKAKKEQATAVAECLLNIEHLDLTDEERKCLKKYKSLMKKFSKTNFTLLKLKRYLLKNIVFVVNVIATVLTKIIESSVLGICNNGGDDISSC